MREANSDQSGSTGHQQQAGRNNRQGRSYHSGGAPRNPSTEERTRSDHGSREPSFPERSAPSHIYDGMFIGDSGQQARRTPPVRNLPTPYSIAGVTLPGPTTQSQTTPSPPLIAKPVTGDQQQGANAILTQVEGPDGQPQYVLRPFFHIHPPEVQLQMGQMLGHIHSKDIQLFQFLKANRNFLQRLCELPDLFDLFCANPDTLRPLLNLIASTVDMRQFYSNFSSPPVAPAARSTQLSLPPPQTRAPVPAPPALHVQTITPNIANLPQPRQSWRDTVPAALMPAPQETPDQTGVPHLEFLSQLDEEYKQISDLVTQTMNKLPLKMQRSHPIQELRVGAILKVKNEELEQVYHETRQQLHDDPSQRGIFPFSKDGLFTTSTDFARSLDLDEDVFESVAYFGVRALQSFSEQGNVAAPLDIIAAVASRGFERFERGDCYGAGVHLYDYFDFADLGSSRLLNKYRENTPEGQLLKAKVSAMFQPGNDAVAAVIVNRVCVGKRPQGLLRSYSDKDNRSEHTAIISRLTPENLTKCVTCSHRQVLPLYVVIYERVPVPRPQ